jgi:tetratricopeptide (TPR) repeat protein
VARDIQRYLADEPVEACPPSRAYKLRKFARKNKKALVTAGAFMLVLAALGGGVGWVLNDRAARQREANAKVRDAESRIEEALEAAKTGLRDGNPADLTLIAAVKGIEAQLNNAAIGPEVQERAEQFLRDVGMLADLDQARLPQAGIKTGGMFDAYAIKTGGMFDASAMEARYAALFPGYGIDVLALDPAEAAARIRASAIHEALLAGLDGWMQITGNDRDRAHLRQVADAADDNAWRRAFREAALAANVPRLKALMGQPEALAQRPAVLGWLGGWSVRSLGLQNEAAVVLRQVQQRHPADYWVNYNLGDALAVYWAPEQYPGEGLGYARVAVGVRPSSAYAHGVLGVALFRKGETDAAIAAYQQALALDPKCGWVRGSLADALRRKGDLNGLIACYRKVVELDPKNPWPRIHLGEALRRQGKRDEAIACFKEAEAEAREVIRLKPDDANAYSSLGLALADQGRYEEAEAAYREAIRLNPKSCGEHYNLGLLLSAQNRWAEAEKEYRTNIRMDPNAWPEAHQSLGEALY